MFGKVSDRQWVTYSSVLISLSLLAALHYNGYQPYLFALCWLSLFLVGVYQAALLRKVTVPVDATALVLLAFVLWLVISLVWHPLVWRGVEYNWRAIIFVYTFFVTIVLLRDKDVVSVQYALLFVALLTGLLSVWQFLILEEAPSGPFINKNSNAAFLNLFILPLVTMLLFGAYRARFILFISLLFVLMFFVVLQIGSRGALLSLLFMMATVGAVGLVKKKYYGTILVGVLAILTIVLHQLISDSVLRTHLEAPSRWYLYASTIEMIKDADWYGVGNGMFRHLYYEYRDIADRSSGSFVHNDYLQLLLEVGIPGLLLLAMFAVLLTYKIYLILVRGEDKGDYSICLGMYSGIAAVAIHSMVTFNFYQSGILLVCGFYAGVILRRANQLNLNVIKEIPLQLHNKMFLISISGLGILLAKSVFFPGYADAVATAKIDPGIYERSVSERMGIYNNLRLYDPHNPKYPMWVASLMFESGRKESLEDRTEIYKKARALFSEAKALNRYSPDAFAKEAFHLSQYRDVIGLNWHQEVISLAARALLLEPRLTRVRLLIAETLVDKGSKEEALRLLLKGLDYPSNQDMRFYQYGKNLALSLGNADAVNEFQHAIDTNPDAPG